MTMKKNENENSVIIMAGLVCLLCDKPFSIDLEHTEVLFCRECFKKLYNIEEENESRSNTED